MAGSLEMSQLGKKKEKNKFNLPTFDWKRFKKRKKLGSGTFGVEYLGKYSGHREVVVKKVKDSSYDAKARCSNEAALLNSTNGHPNIIEFLAICDCRR